MTSPRQPEVWLRGLVAGVPELLQPVAHSLLQCREELQATLERLTPEQIWTRRFGAASIGFHARHAAGSLNRLFSYARGERLSAEQHAAFRVRRETDHPIPRGRAVVIFVPWNANVTLSNLSICHSVIE